LYLAQASYGNAGLRGGVEDQLFEQAVAWAGVPEPATMLLVLVGLAALRRTRG
jgi:hypothetical protein